jgi:hypothetical protein
MEGLDANAFRLACEALREEVVRVTRQAADADSVSVVADQLAFVVSADCMVVNAPMAGLESVDVKAVMNGAPLLDNQPVMYWYVSGKGLDKPNSGPVAGFYSIIARLPQRRLEMRGPSGDFVGDGDVQVGIAAKTTLVGAGFDPGSDIGWRHIKVCGHVTYKVNGATVTVSGCISISV